MTVSSLAAVDNNVWVLLVLMLLHCREQGCHRWCESRPGFALRVVCAKYRFVNLEKEQCHKEQCHSFASSSDWLHV